MRSITPPDPMPADPTGGDSASARTDGRLHRADEAAQALSWELPVETPAVLRYNGDDFAVMMVTPQDLADFALGFSLSEGIVLRPGQVRGLAVTRTEIGWELNMQVPPAALARMELGARRIAGRSGCGICGVQGLEQVVRMPPPLNPRFRLDPAAVRRAFAELPGFQPINRCNRSVHAAALCRPDGVILLAREDVGRHNAMDKLIGAAVTAGIDPADGFVALTSRCSYELVQKAATVGIPAVASLSAPTTLALDLARRGGLQLAASCPDGIALFP
jgi:FdhD protein